MWTNNHLMRLEALANELQAQDIFAPAWLIDDAVDYIKQLECELGRRPTGLEYREG